MELSVVTKTQVGQESSRGKISGSTKAFSLLQSVQTGFKAPPGLCLMGSGAFFGGGE